jgi:hypothetical protein
MATVIVRISNGAAISPAMTMMVVIALQMCMGVLIPLPATTTTMLRQIAIIVVNILMQIMTVMGTVW